jgi:hypothetical protein
MMYCANGHGINAANHGHQLGQNWHSSVVMIRWWGWGWSKEQIHIVQ